jgi:hypothetical protein
MAAKRRERCPTCGVELRNLSMHTARCEKATPEEREYFRRVGEFPRHAPPKK